MEETIKFTLNGKPVSIKTDTDRKLLWVLRVDFGLTGVKYGCGKAICGACTVLLNNQAVRSCSLPVSMAKNKDVTTIEGLEANGELHPIQKAFVEYDALQCGYCIPGIIMNACSYLRKNPGATSADIIKGMNDNLCRCGSYHRIVKAIETAAVEMRGE